MKINYGKLFVLNYVLLLSLELIFKLLVIKTLDIGILYIVFFTLFVASIVTIVMSLFKKTKINKIISIILWLVIFLIFASETVYYSFYKTICGFEALIYGGQVMDFASAIMTHIKINAGIIGAMFIPFLIVIILTLFKKITYEKFRTKDALSLIVVAFFLTLTVLEVDIPEVESAKKLYYSKNDLMQTTNTLGLFNAISLDTIKLVTNFEENVDLGTIREFTKNEEIEYNVTNINFDDLISKEKDKTVKNMHTYFSTQEPSNKNDMTGIFAGKNLIFIVAEGFYPIAVDENLTPTLYKLVNNGFVFDNYYQPIYNCSTSDGEFINQLSILPGVATCSMKETSDVYLPYSVGNILKKYGYEANAFHGWTYNYYSRDKTIPNLGYTYYGYDRYKRGYKYALKGIKDQWPTSDIDVINNSYDIYSDKERFVTYYMSISGHLEYNFMGGNAIAKKNKDLVQDMQASSAIKAYMATQIEFDRSLEILLKNLEKDGILDDTVIVISADHYPYGLSNSEIAGYASWMKDANFDLYKNNLVIYNSELKTTHVAKYTSSLDLLPTLLNLFGVEYDSRLLIGRDIFSTSSDLVIFNNKSWITDKGRYNYLKHTFEPFTDEDVSDEYIDEINKIVELKFQMSKLLISKDYYRKLGGL